MLHAYPPQENNTNNFCLFLVSPSKDGEIPFHWRDTHLNLNQIRQYHSNHIF